MLLPAEGPMQDPGGRVSRDRERTTCILAATVDEASMDSGVYRNGSVASSPPAFLSPVMKNAVNRVMNRKSSQCLTFTGKAMKGCLRSTTIQGN